MEGTDPRPARRERHQARRDNTVASVAKRFIELDAKKTVESWQRIERTLDLHVLPVLGDKPIRDIGKADLHDLLDGIVENTGIGAAYGALKHMHRLFEFALDRELIDRNPARKLKRPELKPKTDNGRALNDDELRAIWKAAGDIGYPAGPALRLLMLTGQRRNEISQASRGEVDIERRTLEIPARRYKGRRDHVVPLVGPAWEIFNALPIQTGGDFLFSNRAGKVAINSWDKAKKRIYKLTGPLARWTLHDFRRTVETRMARIGIVKETRDAVLGHAKPGLQKTYNKHDYELEKQDALLKYADHLMGVVS